MAASSLAKPGSEYGPCEGECQHTDCAATRAMAECNCVSCAEPIGYEVRFFLEDEDVVTAKRQALRDLEARETQLQNALHLLGN